jgi:hypothetical protein
MATTTTSNTALGGLFAESVARAEYRANSRARTNRKQVLPYTPGKGLQERFEAFDAAHPEVYEEIVRLARTMLTKKKQHKIKYLSMAMIFEYMRMQFVFESRHDREPYKLSNDFRSRYARKIMEQCPEFDGAFKLRDLTAH